MLVLKKSYKKKRNYINNVKSFKKKKTKKSIEQRNKSQKGLGQQSSLQQSSLQQNSFLDRLLGPNEMVFMGDPQCNLKDCCFSLKKEQDEELVIKGLQDQNKYLKDELKEMKNKFKEQKNTLNQLGETNLDSIEKLKEYLIREDVIKLVDEKKNLWNWSGKYLEYIEIKNIPQKSDDVQQAGAGVEDSSNSSIKQPEEQPKESKHELVLVEEFKLKNNELKITVETYNKKPSKSVLNSIKKQLTEIGLFIDKHLNKISIMFYNKKKYSQEQVIYRELLQYLLDQGNKVISVDKNIAQWSEELINSIKHIFKPSDSNKTPILGSIYPSGDKDKNKRTLIYNIQPELDKLKTNLGKDILGEDNLQLIQSNLKEIQQFITKNLKEIAINFNLETDLELKEDLKKIPNNALKDYLIDGKIIQIDEENKWKWSNDFNELIKIASKIKNEKNSMYEVNTFSSSLKSYSKLELNLDNSKKPEYNQKLINKIKLLLSKMIQVKDELAQGDKIKNKVSSFLNNDIMNLGKQINKDLQQIKINYHNGKKFKFPNLEDTPVYEDI